jgi:hypothetical protein
MERWKKEGNYFPSNNKWVQEPEGNEKIRYPVPDFNKTMINYAKEHNEAHKTTLKEDILASNQWEFYRDATGYGQPKCTWDTQEIPRQQK